MRKLCAVCLIVLLCFITSIALANTPVKSVKLSPVTLKVDEGCKSAPLEVTVAPENADNSSVVWSSANENIAVVDEYGVVTGVKAGSTTIYAKAADGSGEKASCKVTVQKAVTAITLNETDAFVSKNGTLQLKATQTPDAAKRTVTWTSSDDSVCTVNSKGTVTGRGTGSTVVTATVYLTDGTAISANCNVTIVVPVSSL